MQALHPRPVAMTTTTPLTPHSAALLLEDDPPPVQETKALKYMLCLSHTTIKNLGFEQYF